MKPSKIQLIVCLLLALSFTAAPTLAQQEDWQITIPASDPLDWIQLEGGEWLHGEIKGLRDEDFQFDSDEFDEITLEWEKVITLRSTRLLTFGFEENGVVAGSAIMEGDIFRIQTATGIRELPRSDLLGIIEGKPSEWNYWALKFSLGVIVRTGNTEQEDLNTLLRIRRQTTRTRLNLEYKANYSKVNNEETVNNQHTTGTFDYVITKGFFVTPFAGELYSDRFQNIDLRATIAAGVGYYVFRGGRVEWSLNLTGGYQSTEYASVEEGEPTSKQSAVIIPSTNLETDITRNLELTFNFNSSITLPDTDGTLYHAFLLFEYELTSLLDLDLSLTWDRVQKPQRDAEGNLPQRDDLRTAIGLGIDF